ASGPGSSCSGRGSPISGMRPFGSKSTSTRRPSAPWSATSSGSTLSTRSSSAIASAISPHSGGTSRSSVRRNARRSSCATRRSTSRSLSGRGDRDEVAQGAEPGERLTLELADPLARQVELVPDRLERPGLALEAEAQVEDTPLALRERFERAPHALPAERLFGLVERIGWPAVGGQGGE